MTVQWHVNGQDVAGAATLDGVFANYVVNVDAAGVQRVVGEITAAGGIGHGMAAPILILPIAILAMLAWVGFLGLTFVGRVPGGRPPAWGAGKAIPWPRPGDQVIADSNGDAIEGDATEVDADASGDPGPKASSPQKRKRKNRG